MFRASCFSNCLVPFKTLSQNIDNQFNRIEWNALYLTAFTPFLHFSLVSWLLRSRLPLPFFSTKSSSAWH